MGFLEQLGINQKGKTDALSLAENNIRTAEFDIEQAYLSLGKKIFALYEEKNRALLELEKEDSEYKQMLLKIYMTKENRDSYYKNFLQLQGLMECVNCKSKIPFGSVFCSNCGCKSTEVDSNFVPSFTYCTNCGEKVEKDNAFCLNCGNKM